jgi:hypothetical protein
MQYLLNPELKIKHKNTIKLKQLVKKVLKWIKKLVFIGF